MTLAYYTTSISENLEETPEGFLIARDTVIGRTGWQQYQVKDLPPKAADKLGVDTSNPAANIDLYRKSEDVFHPDTLASYEGKAVVDNHPPEFVTPENFSQYAKGHVQNVRRGTEPLESGEWPVIADIHITAEPLLSKVRNKMARELSCGYDYSIEREGDRINQTDMIGNHVAVVPKGRAGEEARINDAAPIAAQPQPLTVIKEKKPVANMLKHLVGLGLKALALDAGTEPEQLAEAAEAATNVGKPPAVEADDRHADDKQARDKRMHDALQRMLDKGMRDNFEQEPEGSEMAIDRHAVDADMEELRKCMSDAFEPKEPEAEAEVDDVEEEEAEPDGEEVEVGDRARAADGATAVLRGLRPFVARCKDEALKTAFNTALAGVSRSSKASTGGYGKFAANARARDGAPPKGTVARATDGAAVDRNASLQKAYDAERVKGGR